MRLGLAGAAGIPFAAMAAVGTVAAQFWYVAHRPLPSFLDLDPDGVFGPDAAPEVRLTLLGDSTVTGPGLDSPDDLWSRQVAVTAGQQRRVRRVVEHVLVCRNARTVALNRWLDEPGALRA